MTSCDPQPGEIWLAYLYFADQPDFGKVRPTLIVALAEDDNAVVAAKITTSTSWSGSEYIEIESWEEYSLRKPSFIQLNPLFEIEKQQLLRNEPLSKLPKTMLQHTIERINAS